MVWMVWQDCCYAVLYYNISLALIACNNFCFETTKVDELSAQPQADGQICTTKFFFFSKETVWCPFCFGRFISKSYLVDILCHRECMVALNALGRMPRLLDVGTWSLQIIPTPRLSMTVFANTPLNFACLDSDNCHFWGHFCWAAVPCGVVTM